MPPTAATLKFWKSELRSKLLIDLSRYQREHLKGKGEITEGDEIQGPCNHIFGLQVREHVVSEYGLAIVLKHSQAQRPVVAIGVSIKDFPHPKPLSYYAMMYSMRDEKWHYDVADFIGDDTDYFYLEMKLDTEFKKWGYAISKDNIPLE